MAPKRLRTSSNYNADRFVLASASSRYEKSLLNKVLIGERGFSIPRGGFPDFDQVIHQRGWVEFYKQPPATVLPLVCEFYANVYEHQGVVARVRGKSVAFDRMTLNRFYTLEDIKYDEYSAYVSDHVDLTEIVNAICKSGTQWNMSNKRACSMKASTLTKDAKIWHYFVGARFMSSSHLSDVTRDRTILIYCILSGKTIDVGGILYALILHSV